MKPSFVAGFGHRRPQVLSKPEPCPLQGLAFMHANHDTLAIVTQAAMKIDQADLPRALAMLF